jgi:4-amino-4-deoxy-L-arabinose transferase-like glycosyltransferase
LGRKAREKRERGESTPASLARPAAEARRPSAPLAPLAERLGLAWPSWPAGESLGWPALAAVAGVALLIRVVALWQMTATPYLTIDTIDARGYQVWAAEILSGQWLAPRHFYQSPLYAYYLAIVQAVFGPSPWPPRVIQILLGSASCGMLALVGARLFNRRVGLIAGLLLATYGPMVLEEVSLAKTALLIFGGLLGFACYLAALARRDARLMRVAGVVFGITVIGVGQWLLALLGLTLYAVWDPRDARPGGRRYSRPEAKRMALRFLGGAMVALLPIIGWNSFWGGGFMLTSGDAGLNLYLGNNELTTGLSGRPKGLRDVPEFEEGDSKRLAEREVGRTLSPAGVSGHWSGRAIGWALRHPASFVATTARKLTVLWNSYEIPDSYHFAFIRQQYMPWLWGGTTFAIVGPLGLLGLVLAARHPAARPLYVICLGYLGVIVLFYVRSRYRMPAVPFLMVFAAAAIDWILRVLPREDWRPVAALGAGLLVAGFFVNRTYCEPARADAPAICLDGDVWYDSEWQKLGEWYERRGDFDTALGYLRLAAAGESQRGPGQTQLWIGRLELALAEREGNPAVRGERLARAIPALQSATQYGWHVYEAQTYLATVHQMRGEADAAVAASDAAVRNRPRDPVVVFSALRTRVALGRCEDARRLREDLRRLRPEDPQADQLVAGCRPSTASTQSDPDLP